MSSLPKLHHFSAHHKRETKASEDRIEDFMDNLFAPMVGIVPFADRKRLQDEVHNHINGLIDDLTWRGHSLNEATESSS